MIKKEFRFYVHIKGEPADPFTNEAIWDALRCSDISTEFIQKEYRGKKIKVWEISSEFAKNLYRSKNKIPLLFEIFSERNFSFQRFRLFEPKIRKKANYSRKKQSEKQGG